MHERFSYKTKADLLRKANELGLELPYSDDISPLLQPVRTEYFNFANRLVVQPMEGYDSGPDGSPSALTERRYLRYADGGSGMIWFEAVAVSTEGRSNPRQLWINESNTYKYRKLNDAIRESAKEKDIQPFLVVQLTHSGRYSKPDGKPHPLVAAPNDILDKVTPHVLTDDELSQVQDQYILAAKLAAQAGFDAIDIKACHGYLMIELLASRSRNNSIYGGEPLQSRSAFFLETIRRIKIEAPGIKITTRLNISDQYKGGFGVNNESEEDFMEALTLVGILGELGIDLINLSMGSPYHNPHVTRPYDNPVPGQALPGEHPMEGVMKMINGTAMFQKKFPGIHFVGSAYSWLRQFAPNVGAEVIRRGQASFIGLGRSSFAYPSLPDDLKKRGAADPSKVCITCSGCTRLIRNLRIGGCVIRDKEIYGRELKKLIADGKL
jgi:2,4-dienoyl-CoA reductase-like NADH-dependent reductase (Old Yellow Enzyme family)